jgi:peroxiredoxin
LETASIHPLPASNDYRFEHPRLRDIVNDMYVRKDELGPGDPVGSFDLPTTAGGRFRSADLKAQGRPVLLVFGSQTCPVTESAAEGLKRLHAVHGEKIRFVMVDVREAHPGGSIRQPQTEPEKIRHADDLQAHHDLPFEVASDDLDGTLHRSLGARPSSAYVIDPAGTIVFRAQWSNETEAIGEALAAIAAGKAPPMPTVTRTLHAIAQTVGFMSPVLDAAGKGARLDTWKVAPPMGLMATVADLFFFLPRRARGAPAMLLTMAILGALAVAAVVAISQT